MKQYDDPRVPNVYGEAELKRMIDEIKASQDALREDRERLLEENKKLTYKVEKDKERIEKLEDKIKGYEELQKLNEGIMAAVLRSAGAVKRRPVNVSHKTVDEAMKGRYQAVMIAEKDAYRLWHILNK